MAEKLLIVLLNTDPDDPAELGAPFFQATVAASMEYAVEIVLTGRVAALGKRGAAERIQLREESGRSLYHLIREAHEAGVVLKVSVAGTGLSEKDMIPEVDEIVGSASVISEAMREGTVTFTY